jgi:L-alanine-DL-glutamate epimerase-like enolase superfamily enzyme
MKLTDANCRTIKFRVISPQKMGVGQLAGTSVTVFLRLSFDNGIHGYGEVAPWAVTQDYSTDEIEKCFLERVLPLCYGRDAREPETFLSPLDSIDGYSILKAGVEMALYDALGRHLQKPLYELLGGRKRDFIQLSYSVSLQDVDAELEELGKCYAEGYRIFKVKTGWLDLEQDIERLHVFKENFPEAELRVDFNELANPATFARFFTELRELGIDFIEQPFKRGEDDRLKDFGGHGALFVADESCKSVSDLKQIIEQRIYGAASVKLAKIGGFHNVNTLLDRGRDVGVVGYAGGRSESVLGVTAAVHFFCTRADMLEGCDFYFPYKILEPQPLNGGTKPKDGKLYPPDLPGIGCSPPDEWFT